ncbi:aadcd47a-8d10-4cba-8be5-bf8b375da42b [Thermothielavioides terrestris]|uniref:DUF1996 domain-containing protein n=2 Tax=Thermothielavioides terrestris TaxID=2587410 RepID=G2QV20_THETT|nr:uncharacterized protein THITE_2086109 [Thermothielavioides terrestris NRRL 8126]AEO64618.1 hypothetical protein THITE_2086109 [Thermothielavioides terrestris NRRL 8126]SPQ26532.1 aadcd47a-8d10-4cba-8be5-bf8b375da42b [Thermothielavioides terrestris]
MQWTAALLAAAALAPGVNSAATLRFSCAQLVVDRLDPLVNPGMIPSPHLHQVVGGNAFNVTMDHELHDQATTATCTSCMPTEDFSNYWTAVLFFRARNGTYKRVNTMGNGLGYTASNGGQTVYYLSSGKVTAFRPGFRMTVGNPAFRTEAQARQNPSLQFTCLDSPMTRTGYRYDFPTTPCKAGIMVTVRFPTCWDGKNVDSPDHQSHVAYPNGNSCPASHPVAIPQVFYETYWDTRPFNDQSLWPEDGSQPFVWSFGDPTGYGNHGDYMFGWKGDALQRAMDANCQSDLFSDNVNCPTLKLQSIPDTNKCTLPRRVHEDIDGWLKELPGASMQNMS